MTEPRPLMRRSVWRNRNFRFLWLGQAASLTGFEVGALALPVVAALHLNAPLWQVGLMTGLNRLPTLLVGLFAGVLADRLSKHRIMVYTNCVRLLAMGSIPVSASFNLLTMGQVFVVVVIVATGSALYDPAYLGYAPSLVNRDQLVEANTKLTIAPSLAGLAGPSLGGALVAGVGAAFAILGTTVMQLLGTLSLLCIRSQENRSALRLRSGLFCEVREGLAFVLRTPTVRRLAICSALAAFLASAFNTLWMIYLVRDLEWPAEIAGLVVACGGLGGVIAGLAGSRLARRFGTLKMLRATSLSWLVGYGAASAIGNSVRSQIIMAFVYAFFMGGAVVFIGLQRALSQGACPDALLGRMSASFRWLTVTAAVLAGPLAGLLGSLIGARLVLALLAAASTGVPFIIFHPSFRRGLEYQARE